MAFPTQNLDRFSFPTIGSTPLAPWASAGLAVEANPNDDSGIVIQLGWGTKEFNNFLQSLFPTLFQYLGTVNPHVLTIEGRPDDVGPKKIDYSWPYNVLRKNRKKYTAVNCTHPIATTYKENMSGDSASSGFRAKALFLGTEPISNGPHRANNPTVTKEPVPQAILDRWFSPNAAPSIPHALPTGKRGRGMSSYVLYIPYGIR